MFQGVHRIQLEHKSQSWLQGPLKHFRAAALAAALLPLASMAAAPAAAQECVGGESDNVCGFVWNDANNDGTQDDGLTGIAGVTVTISSPTMAFPDSFYTTLSDGFYFFTVPPGQQYTITVNIPPDTQPSLAEQGGDDTKDSDGTLTNGNVVASGTAPNMGADNDTDFGFAPEGEESDGEVPNPCDFLTSGGFVFSDAGKKVTFGIHGGCKHGEFWGHLNVVDHGTGLHINSTEITGYFVPSNAIGDFTREICGLATTNQDSSSVYFRVRLIDNGEPGKFDLMGIRLSTGYHVSTRLLSGVKPGGGNIQLHDPNPSTTLAPGVQPDCGGVLSPDQP